MLRLGLLSLPFLTKSVYCEKKSPEEIFDASSKSSFTVSFLDPETSQPKFSCTGFFITNDGLGVSSGPLLKFYHGCTAVVTLPDSKTHLGTIIYYPSAPGLGFIQINSKVTTSKLPLSKKECEEGEQLYVFGIEGNHVYFHDVLVTDNRHKWLKFEDDKISATNIIRTTGVLPKAAIGGPLIDQEGNTVAVVFTSQLGLGIAYSIKNLNNTINESSKESWAIVKAWKRAREYVIEKLNRN